MTREEMLRALQADVNDWPRRLKEAGVKNAGGWAYVPLPRNNEILRTPDDPEATYAYMLRSWQHPDAERGSSGWYRLIKQGGPELTWEWLIADPEKPYAALFPDDLRQRVRRALERDAGYKVWLARQQQHEREEQEREREAQARAERVQRLRDELRSGQRRATLSRAGRADLITEGPWGPTPPRP